MLQDNLDRFLMVAQKLKLKGLMGKDDENSQQEEMITVKEECKTEELNPADKPNQDNVVGDKVKVPVSSESINELENALNQHLERLGPGLYQCKLCGKTARMSTDIKKHIETHIEGLSYPCQVCGKTFSTTNSIRSHRSQHHRQ